MAVDVLFEVWHATVADLDGVSVKALISYKALTCSLVISASSSLRKVRPMLVETFLLNWGLYQMMPLSSFFLLEFEVWVGMFEENVRRCL